MISIFLPIKKTSKRLKNKNFLKITKFSYGLSEIKILQLLKFSKLLKKKKLPLKSLSLLTLKNL